MCIKDVQVVRVLLSCICISYVLVYTITHSGKLKLFISSFLFIYMEWYERRIVLQSKEALSILNITNLLNINLDKMCDSMIE